MADRARRRRLEGLLLFSAIHIKKSAIHVIHGDKLRKVADCIFAKMLKLLDQVLEKYIIYVRIMAFRLIILILILILCSLFLDIIEILCQMMTQ